MRSYSVDKPIIIKAHAVKYFTIPRPDQPFTKPHYPSKSTKLASLVKGRWIDGKAQALILLLLLAICPPFLYCKLFCRQDGGIAIPSSFTSHQPFTKPHYPSKIAITLALIAPPVAPNTAIPTTILKEQQSLAQHFPHKPKNRTSSQVRSYLF